MYGSTKLEDTASDFWSDEQLECELCGRTRQCTERFGMVTCEPCQDEFLPSTGGF